LSLEHVTLHVIRAPVRFSTECDALALHYATAVYGVVVVVDPSKAPIVVPHSEFS